MYADVVFVNLYNAMSLTHVRESRSIGTVIIIIYFLSHLKTDNKSVNFEIRKHLRFLFRISM